MGKHLVKCPVCNETFDADSEPYILMGRRYVHKKCCTPDGQLPPGATLGGERKKKKTTENKIKEKTEHQQLLDLIKDIYGSKANYPLIQKQIKDFQKQGYTLSGIMKSLNYFYKIKGNSPDNSNGGIGIIAFCYQQAKEYYYALYLSQLANSNKNVNMILNPKEKEIEIPSPHVREYKRFFKLEEE